MFDNLRDSEDDRQAFQDAIGLAPTPDVEQEGAPKPSSRGLLGMSAAQRLIIALLVLLAVIVIGTMCLLVTGRISAF